MSRHVLKLDEIGRDIARIALPAALALTADPIASMMDTAFIGQIGNFPPFLCYVSEPASFLPFLSFLFPFYWFLIQILHIDT